MLVLPGVPTAGSTPTWLVCRIFCWTLEKPPPLVGHDATPMATAAVPSILLSLPPHQGLSPTKYNLLVRKLESAVTSSSAVLRPVLFGEVSGHGGWCGRRPEVGAAGSVGWRMSRRKEKTPWSW